MSSQTVVDVSQGDSNSSGVSVKQAKSVPSTSLSTSNLFTHYFLIHDFLFHFVKTKSRNSAYFDLQFDVNDKMKSATSSGGRFGQLATGLTFVAYCLKGNNLKLKVVCGFLYMYWMNHWATLGSYAGLMMRMPSVYKMTGEYFLNHEPLDASNYFLNLTEEMKTNTDYEDTRPLITTIFNEQQQELKEYVENDFFIKNRDKYFNEKEGVTLNEPKLKLKYFDSFLTRYVYYSFSRWCFRFGLMIGVNQE